VNREQFDHALRAAAAVLGEREVLVIGSQALHASMVQELPEEAERSVEIDVVPLDDPDETKADLIDGSIGEASPFHETFGYYAQGVGSSTAVLPTRWRDRLVRYEERLSGTIGWCLEPHDLWISKAIAGRPKDLEFCSALIRRGIVDVSTLEQRLADVAELDAQRRARVSSWIQR
jgi:hypothetical protein